MKVPKFNLLFFGSDKFSIKVLGCILSKKVCPVEVVTSAGSLLDRFCAEKQLTRYRWPLRLEDRSQQPSNIGLVASFGYLIDANTVNSFHHGLFNVHPSLLPQYRGSTPIQAAIRDGLIETGCTIMRIPPVAKFDIGEILLQERLQIQHREWAETLRDRLAILGGEMASEILLNYHEVILNARPQDQKGRSYARKLKPEDGLINFKVESSDEIDKKVRAYTGSINLFTYCLDGLRIELSNMRDPAEVEGYELDKIPKFMQSDHSSEKNEAFDVGTMHFHKVRKALCIKCADNRWLSFDTIKPELKPKMSAIDFYNGYLSRYRKTKKVVTDV